MTFDKFHNALRILTGIDMHELVTAGVLKEGDHTNWQFFRQDPFRWFITASDDKAQKVWAIIESRQV